MRNAAMIFLAGALAFAASSANALTMLTFDLLEARWDNPVGVPAGGNVRVLDNTFDTGTREVRWGSNDAPLSDTSGYEYTSRTTPFTEGLNEVFGLGDFVHDNFPVSPGTPIQSVDLFLRGDVTLDVDGDVTSLGTKTFDFTVNHRETANSADPCEFEGPGIDNTNGCADRVDISAIAGTTDTVEIDGIEYTLNILGFATSIANADLGLFDDIFYSPELGSNARVLAAEWSELDVTTSTVVPLPAPAVLLVGAVACLAGASRIRKRA